MVPDDDAAAAMQDSIEAMLSGSGYEHYETSAYARPGHRSRHNLNYWTFGDYLGIGAGRAQQAQFPDRIVRQARYRQPREYMERAVAGTAIQTEQRVAAQDVAVRVHDERAAA